MLWKITFNTPDKYSEVVETHELSDRLLDIIINEPDSDIKMIIPHSEKEEE